jgi:hypothetical protein
MAEYMAKLYENEYLLAEMGKKAKIVVVLQACKCLSTVQTKTQS